jgi:hypothetical protein
MLIVYLRKERGFVRDLVVADSIQDNTDILDSILSASAFVIKKLNRGLLSPSTPIEHVSLKVSPLLAGDSRPVYYLMQRPSSVPVKVVNKHLNSTLICHQLL